MATRIYMNVNGDLTSFESLTSAQLSALVEAGTINYDKNVIKTITVFAGDVNQVMTAGQMLGGIFTLPNLIITAGRTVTTATAAALDLGLSGAITGTSFPFVIVNNDAGDTLTLVAGVGITLDPAVPTIPPAQQRGFTAVKTGTGTWTVFTG